MRRLVLLLVLACAMAAPVSALSPDEILADPVLEERARAISSGLRCLVCQNQSIDDSDADLARDLRLLVRERLVAGDTNAQAEQFIVDRYGEYVLLNPRLGGHTLLLWLAGPFLLLAGLIALFLARRRNVDAASVTLSDEEQAALDRLASDRSERD